MKVVAIIQARMGSTRLPNKVLQKVRKKPLLHYQLERISRASRLDEIVIATTNEKKDDVIVSFCEEQKITYVRGSESDVLKRYVDAAQKMKADVVVRLTADCPLMDPKIIDHIIGTFLSMQPIDYVSNVMERTYPRGLDIEVFTMETLKQIDHMATSAHDREHVTRYFLEHPTLFRMHNVTNNKNLSNHRWTVDTLEDFHLIEKILSTLYPNKDHFEMEDVLALFEKYPEWKKINANIEQKGW